MLLCSTASISPGRKERISQILAEKVDWGYLLELAEFHGVAPLIVHNLISNGLVSQVQQSYSERLSQIYKNTLYRNVILSGELRRAQDLLRAQVPVSLIGVLKPKSWRCWLIDFIVSKEFFISRNRMTKLMDETYTVVRGLMMENVYQMVLVLARHHGNGERAAWLKAAFWIMLVFGAALGRNTARFLSGWRWQFRSVKD